MVPLCVSIACVSALYELLCAALCRRDFAVQFGNEESTSVFLLLQQACIKMVKISHRIHQREVNAANKPKHCPYRRFLYNRFMWGE